MKRKNRKKKDVLRLFSYIQRLTWPYKLLFTFCIYTHSCTLTLTSLCQRCAKWLVHFFKYQVVSAPPKIAPGTCAHPCPPRYATATTPFSKKKKKNSIPLQLEGTPTYNSHRVWYSILCSYLRGSRMYTIHVAHTIIIKCMVVPLSQFNTA